MWVKGAALGNVSLTLIRQASGMSDYIRPKLKGASVFFTVALADRGSRMLVEQIGMLREAVAVARKARPFEIDAWVVLPDHLHAVWTLPDGDADFSTRWSSIKARFTMGMEARSVRASHAARREKGIWQRRFWEHHIRDEADFNAHVRYCWGNPVKHGLAARAVDWPYSSIRRDIRLGRVEPEWAGINPEGAYGE